ncbi:hypothetical protein DU508_02195 [Pedobacter chinensis]|uniref:Uncharacterized protein n=1 Tax=Pedobacter chinensis TaxID=2282421 RepID=A0A369PZX5_9SPHI|nr:hypothetical protein [Pedobacter chinensis]RDC57790.1 hypothetical protein DU508_02195 [Pedobacter chinensis]
MINISLDDGLKLSFEKLPHTIRLIVSKNDEEWVCRKEKLKKLFSFLELDQEPLFKGRLQLFKSDGKIKIKNEFISTISTETFQQALNKLK